MQRQLEFADVLKTLFARRRLVPKMDPLQMATGFAALWSGFAVQGDVSWAKPFDQVFLVFLRALLDNSIPVEEGDGSVESETGNNLVGSAATGEDSDSSLLEMKKGIVVGDISGHGVDSACCVLLPSPLFNPEAIVGDQLQHIVLQPCFHNILQ